MKNQVTSIEQSRRLIGLGVPAEKASMVWAQCSSKYHLSVLTHYTASKEYIENGESTPAFTVADLLNLLPKEVPDKASGRMYELTISGAGYSSGMWFFGYQDCNNEDCIGGMTSVLLLELLYDRIEWLLSNGYKLEL